MVLCFAHAFQMLLSLHGSWRSGNRRLSVASFFLDNFALRTSEHLQFDMWFSAFRRLHFSTSLSMLLGAQDKTFNPNPELLAG